MPLTMLDTLAVALFLAAWVAYAWAVSRGPRAAASLTALMHAERARWMETLARREQRIVDAAIMASLQQGTAFFASTALLAIGGALALARAPEEAMALTAVLPFAVAADRAAYELKVLGLLAIFVYAFFKFAFAYRLFNYAAILMGGVPPLGSDAEAVATTAQIRKATAMQQVAAGHFNRGLRSLFFAAAYLGWFVSPYALMATTAGVVVVLWRRQFASPARRAVEGLPPG